MINIFNLALQIDQQDISISLVKNSKSTPKVKLGGIDYSIHYVGPLEHLKTCSQSLENYFKDAGTTVTKEALIDCLQTRFDTVVVVSTTQEKIQRAKKVTSIITAGLSQESKAVEKPDGKIIMPDYYAEIPANQTGISLPVQNRVLRALWMLDKSTKLSFPEWETFKRAQWENSRSDKKFLSWICHQTWEKSNTKDDYFNWYHRHLHKQFKIPFGFKKWKRLVLTDIQRNKKILGKDATEDDLLRFTMDFLTAGSHLTTEQFFQHQQWQESKSTEHFEDWVWRKQWEAISEDKRESFETWRNKQLSALEERWEKSGMKQAGLSFSAWRKEQDDTQLTDDDTRELIRCDETSRRHYQLHFTAAGLVRNTVPYTTEYESTLHSGKGYAIFVMGPDEEVYAGSHIGAVFHHSSFFGDSAVLAAGEIRTGLSFSIQPVKNEKEKLEIIKKYQAENKDPFNILLIHNESKKTWTVLGENESGNPKIVTVKSDSALAKLLSQADPKNISFRTRTEILDQAAELLGRRNNKEQITLISSKSGHYHPEDEENYYMLKFWEKKGIDLTKTPFNCFMGFVAGAKTFRNAQEYIDQVGPVIRARQACRVFFENGIMNSKTQPLSSMQVQLVLNKQDQFYAPDDHTTSFTHPKLITTAGNLPGFENKREVLKSDIDSAIRKLKEQEAAIDKQIHRLDGLIKHGMKRQRDSRRTMKDLEISRQQRIKIKIAKLEDAIKPSARLGKQEIRGGGTVTTNAKGEITRIDAKLGDYVLSEKEIKKTLQQLSKRGVNLAAVELITYNQQGKQNPRQNAAQYLFAPQIKKEKETLYVNREAKWQPTLWKTKKSASEVSENVSEAHVGYVKKNGR